MGQQIVAANSMMTWKKGFSGAMLAAGLGALAALGGCDSGFGQKVYEQRAMVVSHIAGSALSIENTNGWIDAIQTDRDDVSIEVELYGKDIERLHLASVHADRNGDDSLRVWVEWPGGKRKGNEGASISIQVPDANNIHARTSNGHITIVGLSGNADLNSSNGAIKVMQHDGSVIANTSNGRLAAEHISGEIEMHTSNGRVTITDAFGPILAETSNGKVYVSTMHGNEGPIRIRTSNGSVNLELGEGFQGVLKCNTSNGKVHVEGIGNARLIETTKKRVELQIGDSTDISAIRTSNGTVHVRQRLADISDG